MLKNVGGGRERLEECRRKKKEEVKSWKSV